MIVGCGQQLGIVAFRFFNSGEGAYSNSLDSCITGIGNDE